ncbi:MAG TPA: hypothetical protein VL688_04135 [Verrucomicrobiae bacterium]|jgi:antitoxin component YwqK of YwqJK toxin-antitoxin module|nr:hypothetical protein [Verrucomicrobiae bacterium]
MKKFFVPILSVLGLVAVGLIFFSLNFTVEKEQHLDGEMEKQYFFGKLVAERSYRNGQLNGLTKIYYGDGKIKSEWTFREGSREGLAKQYSPDGNLKFEDEYSAGKRVNRKEFDTGGNMISQTAAK